MFQPTTRAVWLCMVLLPALASGAGATSSERLRRAIHEIPGVPMGAADVAQDSVGFLWIAGDEGLARFDGYEALRWAPEVMTISDPPVSLSTRLKGAVAEPSKRTLPSERRIRRVSAA